MATNLAIDERATLEAFILSEAQRDPSAFIETAITDEKGRWINQGDIHLDMQSFIANNYRGVVMFPREHGKTTQMLGRVAWEIGCNSNIRIKIVSSSDNIAIARGGAIRRLLETSLYQSIFSNIKQGNTWTDSKFTVHRNVISPDGTLECFGIRSLATGGRADLIFFDDPDDEEVVYSEAVRRRNVDRVDNVWLNLLTPEGRAYLLCTPWHERDIAHTRKNIGWPVLRFAINNMIPVWPERWHKDALNDKRKDVGSLAFARGFELVTMSPEDAVIKGDWFKYWETLPKIQRLAIAVDLGISLAKGSDYTAIGLFGNDKDGNIYLISIAREHLDFPSTLRRIDEIAERASAKFGINPTIGIESTAYQQAVPQTLKRSSRYPIKALTAEKNKHWRAERAGVHIENGRVYLHGSNGSVHPDQQIVYDECVTFPSSAHDDTVDVLGYGIEMLITTKRAQIFVSRRS